MATELRSKVAEALDKMRPGDRDGLNQVAKDLLDGVTGMAIRTTGPSASPIRDGQLDWMVTLDEGDKAKTGRAQESLVSVWPKQVVRALRRRSVGLRDSRCALGARRADGVVPPPQSQR